MQLWHTFPCHSKRTWTLREAFKSLCLLNMVPEQYQCQKKIKNFNFLLFSCVADTFEWFPANVHIPMVIVPFPWSLEKWQRFHCINNILCLKNHAKIYGYGIIMDNTFSWVLHIHIKHSTFWYEKELSITTVFQDSHLILNFRTTCTKMKLGHDTYLLCRNSSRVSLQCWGEILGCPSTVPSQWLWMWYPQGKKEWLLTPPSFSLKPVEYSGPWEQKILQLCFSMAVNKYAQSYK